MKRVLTIAFAMLSITVSLPGSLKAVSFSPLPAENEEKGATGVRGKGDIICLFQSGTAEIRREIVIGDVLTVYRQEGNGALRSVGKIRILSSVGEDYLKGEVVEGKVRTGDIAKKGDVAALIISSEDRCQERSK
jgi:multidrug efflux pump subunit AcrA (membrane-fusion protein)